MAYTELTTTSYLRNQRHTGFNSIWDQNRIKVAKGTYGSVVEIYPRFAERAQSSRCYVVIDYNASQHFHF